MEAHDSSLTALKVVATGRTAWEVLRRAEVEKMSRQSKKVVAAVDELTQEEREVAL